MATGSRTQTRHVVGALDALPPGTVQIVEVRGRSIGVVNDQGHLYALRNVCPHHGAPLCRGSVSGVMRPSEPHVYDYSGADEGDRVIRCPWHGYEFRLTDGRSVTTPERMAVRTYRVEVEDGDVVLYM
jgi:nitrite reductase/ring-hydroxylating ferredoxin subunit